MEAVMVASESRLEQQTPGGAPPMVLPSKDNRDDVPPLGYTEYWQPAIPSSALRRKPRRVKMLGQEVGLFRDRKSGRAYALRDWCPHRGVPLTYGRCHFDGTISCVYHGWTFRLADGQCLAALTDGPDSPLPARVRVRSYPTEERAGMIWVFMGEGPAVPLEEDVPEEMLHPDASLHLVAQVWNCNWRVTMDNAIDAPHAMHLHRTSAWLLPSKLPAWMHLKMEPNGKWVSPKWVASGMQGDYPGLGKFPKSHWWRQTTTPNVTATRLPGIFKVDYDWWMHIRWAVPIDEDHTRNFNWAIKIGSPMERALFALHFKAWLGWAHYENFAGQDKWICEAVDYALPEKLCRTDVPTLGWRNLSRQARRPPSAPAANGSQNDARNGDD
jgi:phenylpropionate dioxygenase-like ring-hydroxylating dioxygenase large terminal subunit